MRKTFKPRAYQHDIISYELSTPRCGVWAGMGLGKTVATLTAIDAVQLVDPRPALVLAPLRVAQSTWPDEAAKWEHLSGLEVQPILGDVNQRKAALRNGNAGVFTVNYENIPWLTEQYGERWPFATVISDESTKLKSFRTQQGSKRAKALGRIAHKKIDRFIELTGTPSPNGLQDLWGQSWFLDGGSRLGRSFKVFAERWFRTGYNGYGLEPLPFAQEQIQDALKDICLSLDAADYFDLREPIRNKIMVELPGAARKIYREMEKQMFTEIAGLEVEAMNAAARTNKCLQLANGAAYVDDEGTWKEVHDVKIQALESVIEESAGAPVLVAYNFKSDLSRLQHAFPQGRALDANPDTIRRWNAGSIPILFAHPASAGHGLNLQDGGNILVFFGVNWNLEEHQQIIERIGPTRQLQAGHDRPVFLHYILAADTVDELVLDRLETKREVQDILLEAMKRKGYQ